MKKLLVFLLCIIIIVPVCAAAEDGTEKLLFDNEGNPIVTIPGGATMAICWGELELVLDTKSRPSFPLSDGIYDVYGVPCTEAYGYLGTDDKYHLYVTVDDAFLGAEYAGILAEADIVESVMPRRPDYNENAEHRPLKRGDVNMNGKRDPADYAMAKRAFLGNYEINDKSQFYCADVNGNGTIDTKDYAMIKRSYLGNYLIRFSSEFDTEHTDLRNYIKDRYVRAFGLATDKNGDSKIDYEDIKEKRGDIFVGILMYGYGKDCDMFLTEVFDDTDENNKSNGLCVYKYGDKTFSLISLTRITDGEQFYTVEQAYKEGVLTSLDMEDLCAAFATSGIQPNVILK